MEKTEQKTTKIHRHGGSGTTAEYSVYMRVDDGRGQGGYVWHRARGSLQFCKATCSRFGFKYKM